MEKTLSEKRGRAWGEIAILGVRSEFDWGFRRVYPFDFRGSGLNLSSSLFVTGLRVEQISM